MDYTLLEKAMALYEQESNNNNNNNNNNSLHQTVFMTLNMIPVMGK